MLSFTGSGLTTTGSDVGVRARLANTSSREIGFKISFWTPEALAAGFSAVPKAPDVAAAEYSWSTVDVAPVSTPERDSERKFRALLGKIKILVKMSIGGW